MNPHDLDDVEKPDSSSKQVFVFASFSLDVDNERLWNNGQLIKLQPKAYSLLRYLVERPQRLITKRELLGALWGDAHVGDAVLKTHLNQVRRALRDDVRAPRFIKTVHRRGYCFIARVAGPTVSAIAGFDPAQTISRPLIGREVELSLLRASLTRSAAGQQQLVLLEGEIGIGKTALVRTFLRRMPGTWSGVTTLGHCIEHQGSARAYLPFLQAVARLWPDWRARGLVTVLQRSAPTWVSQVPDLIEPGEHALANGAVSTESMLREMLAALPLLTRALPLVIVLEDLHWADPSTLELIEHLVKSPEPMRLLLIGTYRPQEACSPAHPLKALTQRLQSHEPRTFISIGPLSPREIRAWLTARFGQQPFIPELATMVELNTEGNPLLMLQLIDALVTSGWLSEGTRGWRQAKGIPDIPVAPMAAALVERRLEQLEPWERNVLTAASVVGVNFTSLEVAAAVEADPLCVEDVLVRWSREQRLVRVEGTDEQPDGTLALRCAFVHRAYQRALCERVGPARQAALHRNVVTWQEREEGSGAGVVEHRVPLLNSAVDHPRGMRRGALASERALHVMEESRARRYLR